MVSTLVKTIESNKVDTNFPRELLRERINNLLCQPLLPGEQGKVCDSLKKFVTMEFVYQLSRKYSIISDKIFNLERRITVRAKARQEYSTSSLYDVEVPLVVSMSLEKCNEQGELKLGGVSGRRNQYKQEDIIELSYQVPEITPEARAALADSIKVSAEITAKEYRDDLLSRILIMDKTNGGSLKGPLNAGYNLVWAPSTWNAKIIEKDPAIFMRYGRRNFLVHYWNIPEENSLDALLGEFQQELKFSS